MTITSFNAFIDTLLLQAPEITVLLDPADCWLYSYDNSRRHAIPQGVIFPTQHQQVVTIITLCHEFKVPLIARGRGTGTPGGSIPLANGIVLSFERMNKILEINPADRYIVVEPGVTNQQVQQVAAQHGFFWPPDPTSSAYCTIGGNLAYNSAGPRAVKYGTPRENTLGLQLVTGEGRALRTGVYTTKGVVGYDLTRLIIGSEGTLAVITEATLKLTPIATARNTLLAIYDSVFAAATAVANIMAQPDIPCALEFMDTQAINMIRDYADIEFPTSAKALLIIEVDGEPEGIARSVKNIAIAAKTVGLIHLTIAQHQEQADALWRTRKALSPALRKVAPKKINEDVVVPVSRIPDLIAGLELLSSQYQITIVNFGHAGNGNIHVNLLIDPDDPTQLVNAEHCLQAVFKLVLSLKGTLSGEHGIGYEKRQFVGYELEPYAIEVMKRIKQQFDPANILNPGKIFMD